MIISDHHHQLLLDAGHASRQPVSLFTALEAVMAEVIGHRLFTILRQHQQPRELERLFTNQPEAYPLAGRKTVVESDWSRHLLDQGRPFIGYDADDIRKAFPDHETIASLGCASVLNLPLVRDGVVLGSVNLLHEAGYYNEGHVPTASRLADYALPMLP